MVRVARREVQIKSPLAVWGCSGNHRSRRDAGVRARERWRAGKRRKREECTEVQIVVEGRLCIYLI